MNRTIEARVSISTNPATAHIGRYFVDVRDTTRSEDGRQVTTRVTNNPASFIRDLTKAGLKAGFLVTYVDNTGE